MKHRFAILLLMLFSSISLLAQNSTQGKEFWFSFMENGYKYNVGYWVANTVMISAKRACTGTITKEGDSWAGYTFSVEDNGVAYVTIPEMYAYNEDNEEEVDNKSLVLRATDTVSVYICNIANFSFDASFVLPVESLGSKYIIQSDKQSRSASIGFASKETSAFLIVAVEDNTEVDITPSVKTMHCNANETRTVTLSKGQTYSVRSNYNSRNRDLSGSTVLAKDGKKVAVFNGNTLTCIPSDMGNGMDHIFEQALPVDSWGKQFVVTNSLSRARDIVKVTSSANQNRVSLNGRVVATLGYGDSYEFSLFADEGSCFVETTEPSMVYQYNTTGQELYEPPGNTTGDPSMVWIPPVEQRIKDITFCTFDHENATIDSHYVNIVVERDDTGRVYLDGSLINSADFHPVNGNEDYYFVRKRISHDTHHLSCESGLIGHVYGFGEAKGYAYCVGANVIDLSSGLYVNGLWSEMYGNGLWMCSDETALFEVRTNFPIGGVDWDFDDGQTATGEETTHKFAHKGDYMVKAYLKGVNAYSQEFVYDTMTMEVHVGQSEHHDETHVVCDMDTFDYYGVEYTQSGYYERVGTSIYGCDSSYFLTLEMGFTPDFEIQGTHWPIGGSETHISVNEYAIKLKEPRAEIDTVLWQMDCPNWFLEPHGKGETCTLNIYTYLLEPVMLHVWVVNSCDTIHQEFFIQTSYFDVDEMEGQQDFMVAPNPTDGDLMLHFDNMQGMVELQVVNAQGQMVDAFAVDADVCKAMSYSMSHLSNGLYYFVLKNNGRLLTQKVLMVR